MSSGLVLVIRLVIGAVSVAIWLRVAFAMEHQVVALARLRSDERNSARRSDSLRSALWMAIGLEMCLNAVLLGVAPTAPVILSSLGLVAVYAAAVYTRLSWTLKVGAWSRHSLARGGQPFGVDSVACTNCGQSSGPLPNEELDSGAPVRWRCHHCGADNELGPFDFEKSPTSSITEPLEAPHA